MFAQYGGMRIETELRIIDDDGKVVYSNTYAHEEAGSVDPKSIMMDYAVTAPNRTKRQLSVGLERFLAHVEKSKQVKAAPAKKPRSRKPKVGKGGAK